MNDDNDEFANWWRAPEQEELRKSCAMGWGRYIWQASLAALKVELPPERDETFGNSAASEYQATKNQGFNDCLSRATEALQQAGIEVK